MTVEYGYTNDHEAYVRPVANDSPWTCVICKIREETLYIDEAHGTYIWHRYGLSCDHQAHDVCYRKWTEHTKKVGCPCCAPLDRIHAHEFCTRCEQFGHPTCPPPV